MSSICHRDSTQKFSSGQILVIRSGLSLRSRLALEGGSRHTPTSLRKPDEGDAFQNGGGRHHWPIAQLARGGGDVGVGYRRRVMEGCSP
jgi:hypothetical protein